MMMDYLLTGLILLAAVMTALSGTRLGRALIVPPSIASLVSLVLYAIVGTFLVAHRILNSQSRTVAASGFIVFLVLMFALAVRRDKRLGPVVLAVSCLLSVGLVWQMRSVASAGSASLGKGISFGILAMLVISSALLLPGFWRHVALATRSLALGSVGLGLMFLPLFGERINGAAINFHVPLLGTVQPAELGRVVLLIWLARSVAHRRPLVVSGGGRFLEQVKLYSLISAPVCIGVLVAIVNNDLGPALVLSIASVAVMLGAGLKKRVAFVLFSLSASGVVAVCSVSNKVFKRFTTLADPLALDTQGRLEQIGLGMSALAHQGQGLGMGVPKKVPEFRTDMVLAVIGHELGAWHLMAILTAVVAVIVSVGRLIRETRDERSQLITQGLVTAFVAQILLMFGGVMAVTPLTGMPVPFISFSGSSLLSSAIIIAVIASCGTSSSPTHIRAAAVMRRTRFLSLVGLLACAALMVRTQQLTVSAGEILSQLQGRDPIGAKLAASSGVTVITADGVRISWPRATDNKTKVRPENTTRERLAEKYGKALGNLSFPGLERVVGRQTKCRGAECPAAVTTLDDQVQTAAWEAMEGRTGAVVAVDLETGGLLAYVSRSDSSASDAPDRVRSHAIVPGSVVKLVTGTAAVSEGIEVTLPKVASYGPVRDPGGRACGGSLQEAVAISCNPYFARLADSLGGAQLSRYGNIMLNAQKNIDGLPILESHIVDPGSPDSNLPSSGIGLGDARVTPVALLSATAIIARGGKPLCLHLLMEPPMKCDATEELRPEAAEAVARGMRRAVEDGTASNVDGLKELSAAVKTGTADFNGALHNATFTAYAPHDAPKVAVVVFLEPGNREVKGLFGGRDAGPIAVEVLRVALSR